LVGNLLLSADERGGLAWQAVDNRRCHIHPVVLPLLCVCIVICFPATFRAECHRDSFYAHIRRGQPGRWAVRRSRSAVRCRLLILKKDNLSSLVMAMNAGFD
jgi:hypothetical protein